jgi:pyroglutamyl-peptidase
VAERWRFLDCEAVRTFPAVYRKTLRGIHEWWPKNVQMNILLTGFGPFPGAPFNPTGRLVEKLARSRRLAQDGVQCTSHVFCTSYRAVDRELPALLARTKPDVLVMFGLAGRTHRLRIETRARNALSCIIPDAARSKPPIGKIAPGAAPTLAMRVPAQWLVRAARSSGVKAAPSHDAGRYLCNYLCWRAAEAARQPTGPTVAAFVHVPLVQRMHAKRRAPLTFDQLARAGEAIVLTAMAVARTTR